MNIRVVGLWLLSAVCPLLDAGASAFEARAHEQLTAKAIDVCL